jgi:hypothetical protein
MGSPTSVTTENGKPRGMGGACSKGTPAAATDNIDAAYSDERTRTADLLITSARSAVSGCCRGLQIPFI